MKMKSKSKSFSIDSIQIVYANEQANGCKGKRNKKVVSKLVDEEDFSEIEDKFIAYWLYKYGYTVKPFV